ncbi:hypothetical protein evm_010545 [Chilo suppressalis]|nr:hypothetical protein evm_010545 [Chilo suppressalis]
MFRKVLSVKGTVGCQQGDPLGPAIFSLAIQPIIDSLNSKFNVWYLDDGTIAGDISTVLSDFRVIIDKFKSISLDLIYSKCELFIPASKFSTEHLQHIVTHFSGIVPNIKNLDTKFLRLLGSPIFDAAIPIFINEQTTKFQQSSENHLAEARNAWCRACPGVDSPSSLFSQRQCDESLCLCLQSDLLASSENATERARLLAVFQAESGYWLQALPSASIGTLLDKSTLSLAISLRLGVKTNHPHRCRCGTRVGELGHHGLSCQMSAGRVSRHACINDVIRRALVAVNVPAVLEPSGIFRDDGKRPDGMTLIPWKQGRPLVWDATCADTLAPCHTESTSLAAGAAAASAECSKRRKYSALNENYIFVPFGVETMGPWGPSARSFFREISKRLTEVTGDQKAGSYLAQRISLAIQRGNAASLLGTIPDGGDEDNQSGFIRGKSTEDATLLLSETIVRHLDDAIKVLGVFLDLSKAFDTVSIPLLLHKLEIIGVCEV